MYRKIHTNTFIHKFLNSTRVQISVDKKLKRDQYKKKIFLSALAEYLANYLSLLTDFLSIFLNQSTTYKQKYNHICMYKTPSIILLS